MYQQASRVRVAVEGGSIFDLVMALVEPDSSGHYPPADEDEFPCPTCQARPGSWVLNGPAGKPAGGMAWCCDLCGAYGTRWGLVRRVLEDPHALARFLAFVPAA